LDGAAFLGGNVGVTDAEREQIKLRAAALDRISTACTTIGVLAPLAGTFLNAATPTESSLFVACFIYLGAALILHYAAIYTLDGLDE
jgi:hypothetical protein